ncbi:MAG TPA: hypothetical protein DEP84_06760 [Chloroflexi bacterium]|nr:hypothetical protein [Chloroflexota bacterium]
MQYLHPPTELEELAARGDYLYLRNTKSVGQEVWELYQCHDGSVVWRSELEDESGHVLSHLLLNPERRPDRLQIRLRPSGQTDRQAVYTFFDDNVMMVQHGRRTILDLPPDYTLMAVDIGSRALALPPVDWGAATPTPQMVFTVQLRDDAFWSKPVKWTAYPLGTGLSVTLGDTPYQTRAVRLSVPGLPDQRGWFDSQGIPLRWQSGEGENAWEAWLTHYVRLHDT